MLSMNHKNSALARTGAPESQLEERNLRLSPFQNQWLTSQYGTRVEDKLSLQTALQKI